MDKSTRVRVCIAIVVSLLEAVIAGYQYAWHKDFLNGKPFQSLGFVVLVVVAAVLVYYGIKHHNWWSTPLGVVIGVAAALWGHSLWDHISWGEFGRLVLALALIALPFVIVFAKPGVGGFGWLSRYMPRISLPRRRLSNP